MRFLSVILISLMALSCGDSAEQAIADTALPKAPVDSGVYVSMRRAVDEIQLPFLMAVDSIANFKTVKLDEKSAYDLLPGEFEFESYKEVFCFGHSVAGKTPLLWFLLVSAGDFEEWTDNRSIVVVMYDGDSRPYDVYNTSYTGVGYGYSYVRTDSVFSLMIDEMENINITTASVAITERGFITGKSETETFKPDEQGYLDSRAFASGYIIRHSPEMQAKLSE